MSFTVETDGLLPDGSTLADAISDVENSAPADWFGVNCAHPPHLVPALDSGGWQRRLQFFRPNASTMSHQELDEMEVLDVGDIHMLVATTSELRRAATSITVVGGCCGADSRYVAALWGTAAPAR